ncbi:MAG: hypothetical protein WBP83_06125 [Nitrososphaeraceae archaeon]
MKEMIQSWTNELQISNQFHQKEVELQPLVSTDPSTYWVENDVKEPLTIMNDLILSLIRAHRSSNVNCKAWIRSSIY